MIQRTKPIIAKNIGRSNQTTAIEQAELEALSLARKKMDENYKLTIPEQVAGQNGFTKRAHILPMLAKSFEPKKLINSSVVHVQPKLDGIRCITYLQDNKVIMKTRKGKNIEVCTEIAQEAHSVLSTNPSTILDGEIYKHGWNFSQITSATKKRANDTAFLEYHIYDMVSDKSFGERKTELNSIFDMSRVKNSRLVLVLTEKATNNTASFINEAHTRYTQAGYEGCMVRLNDCKYQQDKRSSELLKRKDFQDEEFIIIGGEKELLQDGNHGVIYKVQDPNNSAIVFSVRPTGTMEERTKELNNLPDSMGKFYKIKFQGKSADFIPRFPVGVGIRAIG